MEQVQILMKNAENTIRILADKYIWEEFTKQPLLQETALKALNKNVKLYGIMPTSIEVNKLSRGAIEIVSNKNMIVRFIEDKEIFHTIAIGDEDMVGFSFKDPKTQKVVSGMAIQDELLTRGTIDYFTRVWNSSLPVENTVREEAKKALQQIENSNIKN